MHRSRTPRARRGAVAAAAAGLATVLAAGTPALTATGAGAPVIPPGVEDQQATSSPSDVPDIALAPAGEAILTDREDAPVAPGVVYTSFDRYDARGWVRGDMMVADLTSEDITFDYLNSGAVAGTGTLSSQVERGGAIGAVNGDGFDINDTGAPYGMGVQRGPDGEEPRVLHGYADNATRRGPSLVIGKDGLAEVAQLFLEGTASDGDSTVTIGNLNSPHVAAGGVGLYTSDWGSDVQIGRALDGADPVREVVLRDGTVVENDTTVDHGAVLDGEQVLVGREAGAELLTGFEVGDEVQVTYGAKGSEDLAVALNGFFPVAIDGEVVTTNDRDLHPRTVVGVTGDGEQLVLMTVDGRQADSRGLTEVETAELVMGMGYPTVLNLDGGGSSEMINRTAGETAPTIKSSPSDGGERHTANSLGLFVREGSGELEGFTVAAADAARGADTDTEQDLRVLTGQTRVLRASGYDETYAPVEAAPSFVVPGGNALVCRTCGDPAGVVTLTGHKAGQAGLVVRSGAVVTTPVLTVLGEPVRLTTSTHQVSLASDDVTGTFQVSGQDADGFTTWLEPADVTLDYDESAVSVAAEGDHFRVTPLTDSAAGVITVTVGDLRTQLSYSVGLGTDVIDTMDDVTTWRAVTYPAAVTASLSTAPGRDGGSAVAMDYSLTGTTATRAAYLTRPARIELSGDPQRLGAWVHGDGKGAWLRANIYEATGGSAKTVDLAAKVNWTGWRYVEADIPAGLVSPLSFYRLYVVETVPSRQYSGRIVVDDLTVRAALPAQPLEVSAVDDPAVVTQGSVPEGSWRYAVLSDVQFTADNPDSDLVAQARRTLREALAADPEFIVITGDFVDRGFAEDIALAQRVITEEVGDRVPVHYVPGNHEAAGPGDLTEWSAVFGEPSRVFDHRGTRFLIRDTHGYSLRSGGLDQVIDLQEQLEQAREDDAVNNVVVLQHHPMTDPTPTGGSGLTDPKEAALLQDWLSDFRADSGKGAALMAAGVGTFHVSRTDGVLQVITGNAGKTPSTAPGDGGFTGWALVGVDPDAEPAPLATRRWSAPEQWLRVELRPHVDALELSAPAAVAPGSSAQVTATVHQGGREIPVDYPVAATWAGSAELHVGDAASAPDDAVAVLEPGSGTLTALQAGVVTLEVTVNGETASTEVRVE
ncbi:phosphodiester glycosidase family protein [Ornithinimicrobium cavernae]|uniref:phosphodiester glycosidase family protein n=1 Tax=Ornithinimicrobium cavernae TaxID=2666047 RepID=UPI00137AA1AC|nr:phosphodiester glycosidase family protein [Ornithinimicrobium cavernae]